MKKNTCYTCGEDPEDGYYFTVKDNICGNCNGPFKKENNMKKDNGHKLESCCSKCEDLSLYCPGDTQACHFTRCTVCGAEDSSSKGEKALEAPCEGRKLDKYEISSGHRQSKKCIRDRTETCVYCTLFICEICGGAEGSLPVHCPGRKLTHEESEAIMASTLDYKDGEWIKEE